MIDISKINDKTSIPLFAAIAAVPFLIGGIFWLSVIYASVAEATRENLRQDRELHDQMTLLRETHDGVIELKAHFNIK